MDTLADAWAAWIAALTAAGHDPRPVLLPPADPAAVDATPVPLPGDLRALYLLADGQEHRFEGPHLFPGHQFLPVAQAADEWHAWQRLAEEGGPEAAERRAALVTVRPGDLPVQAVHWSAAWWPFALDGGGNVLVVDTDPPPGGVPGQVVVTGPDELERRVLAPGLVAYLRALAAAELVEEEVDDGVFWWDAPGLS